MLLNVSAVLWYYYLHYPIWWTLAIVLLLNVSKKGNPTSKCHHIYNIWCHCDLNGLTWSDERAQLKTLPKFLSLRARYTDLSSIHWNHFTSCFLVSGLELNFSSIRQFLDCQIFYPTNLVARFVGKSCFYPSLNLTQPNKSLMHNTWKHASLSL